MREQCLFLLSQIAPPMFDMSLMLPVDCAPHGCVPVARGPRTIVTFTDAPVRFGPFSTQVFAIFHRTTLARIGTITANMSPEGISTLSVSIKKRYRSSGFAVEGLYAFLKYFFAEHEPIRIEAAIASTNEHSIRLVTRLGFVLYEQGNVDQYVLHPYSFHRIKERFCARGNLPVRAILEKMREME